MQLQEKNSKISKGDIISVLDGDVNKIEYYLVTNVIDNILLTGLFYIMRNKYIISYSKYRPIFKCTLVAKSKMFKSAKSKREFVAVLNALE